MNEHIKALAEQATEYATTRHPTSNTVLSINSEKFEQKFAELIVKEVIAVYNHDGFQTPSEQDYLVLKHFGVK